MFAGRRAVARGAAWAIERICRAVSWGNTALPAAYGAGLETLAEGRVSRALHRLGLRSDGPASPGLCGWRNRVRQFIPVSVCYGFSFRL